MHSLVAFKDYHFCEGEPMMQDNLEFIGQFCPTKNQFQWQNDFQKSYRTFLQFKKRKINALSMKGNLILTLSDYMQK